MIKKCSYFIGIITLIVLVFSAFKKYETKSISNFLTTAKENITYHVPTENEVEEKLLADNYKVTPITKSKSFIEFKEALAERESAGEYDIVNSYGYMGKYQFGKAALRSIGINDAKEFLGNPAMQEKAFVALLQINKWILRKEISKFQGKRIGGVLITESGILAAAHLGGAGSVQDFLRSNGSVSFSDGYGTNIKHYFKKFAGYDTSNITEDKQAMVM
ncbi:peptidoglycan-binding protein LysM [Paenimyroides tangerinum]|uniref:Peptidoglycan-binding protein LysM n=1 Tax=Paenimyroides tangerinum TaxID=2488728 RepID=A0A3P3WD45_9FLAO|nr:transglycosylase family protein [Paenimyroides tangerinum]RRJ91976.1 peptidoglycan-binding protein LysM [Paenimyroides tangerinum]